MIRVGINGFGRIGRMVFRAAVENFAKDIQVVGINDLLDPDYLAYMLKYDSVHGIFEHDIKVEGNYMIVDGNKIQVFAEKDPSAITWGALDVDGVVESEQARTIVQSMCQLGRGLGMEVIAEGVDSKEQVEILKKLRVDTIQGFYYSKALSKEDYDKFLLNNPFEGGKRK